MPKILARLFGFDQNKLEHHRRILLDEGKLSHERWVSINTDGPLCPLARVYNKTEAKKLFQLFSQFKTDVWFFDKSHWPGADKICPHPLSIDWDVFGDGID